MSQDEKDEVVLPVQAEIVPIDSAIRHDILEESKIVMLPEKMQRFLKMLKVQRGNLTNTCNYFRMDRQTYYNWKKENRIFSDIADELREERLDRAESKLDDLVEAGEPAAVFFTLKLLGRSRGYVDSQKVEHEGAVPVVDIEQEKRKARALLEEQGEA